VSKRRGHGEGSIYRRSSDGLWVGAVNLGWRNGRRVRRTVTAKTQREAVGKIANLRRQVESGGAIPPARLTVGEYLEEWVRTTLPGTVRPRTERSYADIVRRHLVPGLGRIPLQQLAPAHVRSFLRTKAEEPGYRGRKLSDRTVQYIHAVLRRALERARKDELVIRNVASLVDPPRVRRAEVQPLTVEEAARLLDAVRDDRLFALYAVALGVGLRRGEALGLRWSDIDFENDTLRVSVSLQRLDGELQLTDPKTARSKRTIPLPACVEALTEHRQRQKQEEVVAPVWLNDWNLVFTTTIGTPLDPQNVLHQFQAVCQRIGVPRPRFHDLRHTCATLLLGRGVHPKIVQELLRHATSNKARSPKPRLYISEILNIDYVSMPSS
jgi:integrase